jgi:hypothetical protein
MPVGPACNSLLDVFVGGCVVSAFINVLNATQPDVGLNGTAPTTLTIGAGNKVNLTSADLNDAYSSAFTFAANRAHFTGETCQATAQCQAGQTCTAGVCH